MGMHISTVGYGYPAIGLPQERGPATQAHIPVMEGRTEAPSSFEASLPGTNSVQDLQNIADELEKISLAFSRKLRFVVDYKTKEVIVKVIDPSSDKVIKELPPEEMQRLHQRIKEALGLLFDQTV
ncbi:MAG TPA: flagellar protein FlaG [Treponema sp.]|uniref:flagellar protein FlaG n=1 Tax=Gracilinema caldarium TaxID=215591 RepID=UPI0016A12A85|nr:flagellar protein FlaG [Gracilinema caldarium]NLJ09647.1 flagellar protein FlaG [Treponema sp.]HON14169.1 flagellar protein FlaG [Treponema sp.]HPC70576.1 flagellar protein FlaG [Treponema sp.]HRS03485.1 flagellar protein FlaG [Treponema sp.]HRU28261.1 flagellar protein FlaG [Treponema sp.]